MSWIHWIQYLQIIIYMINENKDREFINVLDKKKKNVVKSVLASDSHPNITIVGDALTTL